MRTWSSSVGFLSAVFVFALVGCQQGEGSPCQQQSDCPASFLCCGASAPGAPVVRFGICQRTACVVTEDAGRDARIDATAQDASTDARASEDAAPTDAQTVSDAAQDQGLAVDLGMVDDAAAIDAHTTDARVSDAQAPDARVDSATADSGAGDAEADR